MDALITTILAGAAVAVIGAFAAYYFGGRRERQKRVYEERRDEERQREARQHELNQRRIAAVEGLHFEALSVAESFISWFVRTSEDEDFDAMVERFPEIVREGKEELLGQLEALRNYYAQQEPYLEPEISEICSALYTEPRIMADQLIRTMENLYWHHAQGHGSWWSVYTSGVLGRDDHYEQYNDAVQSFLDARWEAILWKAQVHEKFEALSAETKRLAGVADSFDGQAD